MRRSPYLSSSLPLWSNEASATPGRPRLFTVPDPRFVRSRSELPSNAARSIFKDDPPFEELVSNPICRGPVPSRPSLLSQFDEPSNLAVETPGGGLFE